MDYYIQLDYKKLDNDIERARRKNFMAFEINEGAWTPDDLSSLLPYKDEVEGLRIRKKIKLKHLIEFSNLKWLSINGFNEPIDLSYLSNLENLVLCVNKKVTNLNALKKLKILELRGDYGDDLTNIQEMESLEKVQLLWSKVKSLKGIGHLKQLRDIQVESRYLVDLGDINHCENLKKIDITNAPHLNGYHVFSSLKKIKKINLYDAGSINNLKFLNELPNLRYFNFSGTNVLDGDLNPCINVKDSVSFDNKKHYSHKEKDILALIYEKQTGRKVKEFIPKETYKLPYFNEISINPLRDCLVAEEISGVSIGLSLNFDKLTISKEQLEKTKQILEKIEAIYLTAKNHIETDFGKKGEVDYYVNEVIDCLDKEELAAILQDADKKLSKKKQVFSQIHISIIHIYPHENCSMSIYFTIQEGWDGILTVKMDADGVVTDMCVES
jgi:hypothetical protein